MSKIIKEELYNLMVVEELFTVILKKMLLNDGKIMKLMNLWNEYRNEY